MADFVLRPQTVTVVLDDYPGLEVVCKSSASLATVLGFQKSAKLLQAGEPESFEQAVRDFGDRIVQSWNLATEDAKGKRTPIPATGDGLLSVENLQLAESLLVRWLEHAGGIPAPLGSGSPSGHDSPAPSSTTTSSSTDTDEANRS